MKHAYRIQTEARSKIGAKLHQTAAETPKFLTSSDLGGREESEDTDDSTELRHLLEDFSQERDTSKEDDDFELVDHERVSKVLDRYIATVTAAPGFGDLERTGRPPLNKNLITALSTSLSGRCRIRNNGDELITSGGVDILSLEVKEDILASSGEAALAPLEGLDKEKERFWALHELISVVSAPSPAFTDACAVVRVDTQTRLDSEEMVVYYPWQIIGKQPEL
jgi:hypothetical protein